MKETPRRERGTGDTRGSLVLVVDDVRDGRETCAQYFDFHGYRVATAKDGVEAVERAGELLPDVILMDLRLPRMDGLEATRRIKQDERTNAIPVIALTAHALESTHEQAIEAGCCEVVTKPCLPRELEQTVRRRLEARASAEPGSERSE